MRSHPRDDSAWLELHEMMSEGHRVFGDPQSWSRNQRGIEGELLLADRLADSVRGSRGGSALFLGLDLGRAGYPHPYIPLDDRVEVPGFGGDVDAALFVREYQGTSPSYGVSGRRRLDQDHLVLIDSKQYAGDWERDKQFRKAEQLIQWMRHALSHPRMLGSGNQADSLRISYHFTHTGSWVPTSWLRTVGKITRQVLPGEEWWNSTADLVLEEPAEVLLGQLSILLSYAHPDTRLAVPAALWQLLAPRDRRPYT